jgi:Zinc carboxypeptidase
MRIKSLNVLTYFVVLVLLSGFLGIGLQAQQPQTPESFYGFKPGSDRMLFDYDGLISYLKKLEKASPRIKMVEIGKSPMGETMYIAFISSEDNIKNLDALQQINRKLALDATLSDDQREKLFTDGRVFALGTLSMHSGEVGPSQAATLIAYDLATTKDPLKVKWLQDVVYMMVPSHNPDGMDMVVNHYKKYKGSKYEGSSMPGVYHKYVGHDNNRDFVTLSQTDTKAIAAIYNLNWFPQVMVEKHQMGSRGPRYYVPPNHDPIAQVIDEGIWNWAGIFGSNMIKDMTGAGLSGISQHYLFDDYWPGSTETCIWKNVIGFLTEAASSNYASPIYIEPNELRVGGKGLSEYKKGINMPLPWPGGWWRLGDIVDYEISSTLSIIKTASLHRKDILKYRNDLCIKEVNKGKTEAPYHYLIPAQQHDESELVNMINLLKEHGINVYRLSTDTVVNHRNFKKGDFVVPMSQPFRPFLKEVMEAQDYPVRHYTPGGKIIRPYDIASWSLPLHRSIKTIPVTDNAHLPAGFEGLLQKVDGKFSLNLTPSKDFQAVLFTVTRNESFKLAFSALQKGLKVNRLNKSAVIDDVTYPAGSFVINTGSNNAALKQLLKSLAVVPVYLEKSVKLDTSLLTLPRIGLVETYFHDMDAGWARYVFDTYAIPFKVLRPGDFEKTDFVKNFDVLIFPDADKDVLMSGKNKWLGEYFISDYPPNYTKGIGKKGFNRVLQFLEKGGVIVAWGDSTKLFMGSQSLSFPKGAKEEFKLPIMEISSRLKKKGLYCPGSLMKINLKKDHPITLGMQDQIGVFFRGEPVFRTFIPSFDMDRRVIGTFPEKDILMSGYCENPEQVGNQTVLAWLKKNKGQLVLFGFNPQFRASTQAAYKLMFNSILLPKLK